MASSTSVIVVEASRPWPTTTDSGKARSAGKSKSAERPAFASAATYAAWTGIHRVNMVRPSVATPASTPNAPQPHAVEPDSRWSTQSTSPVSASRTCPAMTGAGSRLAAGAATPGDVVLDEQDGHQVQPDERGDKPADQSGNGHGPLISAHAGLELGHPRPVRLRAQATDPPVS